MDVLGIALVMVEYLIRLLFFMGQTPINLVLGFLIPSLVGWQRRRFINSRIITPIYLIHRIKCVWSADVLRQPSFQCQKVFNL